MRRERVEEEMVPKDFEDEERAFDERIVVREVVIIPDSLPGKGGRVDDKGDYHEQEGSEPVPLEVTPEARASRLYR